MLHGKFDKGCHTAAARIHWEDDAQLEEILLHDFLDVLDTAVQNDDDVRDHAFNPCCDHSCHNMHPTAGLRLVSECEDLNPTAQTAHSSRRCPL